MATERAALSYRSPKREHPPHHQDPESLVLRNRHRRKLIRILLRRRARHLPPPTWAELATELYTSVTNVRHHARVLRAYGLVLYHDGRRRTLVITKRGVRVARERLKPWAGDTEIVASQNPVALPAGVREWLRVRGP